MGDSITIEEGLRDPRPLIRRRAELRLSDLVAIGPALSTPTKDHLAELAPEIRLHLYSVIAKLIKEPLDVP